MHGPRTVEEGTGRTVGDDLRRRLLTGIEVPTTLVWGQQDRVMPVAAAKEASVRYGWPLDVIDDAGHFLGADQPEAFLQALRRALDQR